METIDDLEEKLSKTRLAIKTLIEKDLYEDYLKELLSEEETETRCKIARLKTNRSPDTQIIVRFPDISKTIHENSSKDTFVSAIREFGIEEVYNHFPYYFLKNPDNLTATENLAPNRYLIVGLNNIAKKRNLKTIASALNREVYVFLSLL